MLAFDKFDSKKHSGIISYFIQHYVKTEKIEQEYGQILMSAEKIRIQSDYDDFYVASKNEAQEQISNARKFLEMIEKYINDIASIENC